ncbi:MAG: substrate-binding periplasmic protein, partial [Cyanobium sp.]
QEETRRLGVWRSFSKLFQVLATGPGSNTIVVTSRGNGLVIVAYLVRSVSASLLVGYLTVNVVQETQGRLSGRLERPADLLGLRVAVRPGSVSEALLRELNATAAVGRARPVLIARVSEGAALLSAGKVDAVLADNQQLTWLQNRQSDRRVLTRLALEGIRPESQAFVFAPSLPAETAERINLMISALKRQGVVGELRGNVLGEGGMAARR